MERKSDPQREIGASLVISYFKKSTDVAGILLCIAVGGKLGTGESVIGEIINSIAFADPDISKYKHVLNGAINFVNVALSCFGIKTIVEGEDLTLETKFLIIFANDEESKNSVVEIIISSLDHYLEFLSDSEVSPVIKILCKKLNEYKLI